MGKVRISPIAKHKLSQQAYQVLLRHIVGQTFSHGQRLNVDELAQQLGISRTPVKEALSLLSADGLVELVPHIGTFVKTFSQKEIAEIFDIRRGLEVVAAETLLDNILPRDVARLEALIDSMDAAGTKDSDLLSHSRKNHDFHKLLVELSGNRRLLKMYETLHVSVRATQISCTEETWRSSLDEEAVEHRTILQAIRTKDRGELIAALSSHLEHSKQRLVSSMQESAPSGQS